MLTAIRRAVHFNRRRFGLGQVRAETGFRGRRFSCISCHAVGKAGVTLVFDSPGSISPMAERLHRSFFTRCFTVRCYRSRHEDAVYLMNRARVR